MLAVRVLPCWGVWRAALMHAPHCRFPAFPPRQRPGGWTSTWSRATRMTASTACAGTSARAWGEEGGGAGTESRRGATACTEPHPPCLPPRAGWPLSRVPRTRWRAPRPWTITACTTLWQRCVGGGVRCAARGRTRRSRGALLLHRRSRPSLASACNRSRSGARSGRGGRWTERAGAGARCNARVPACWSSVPARPALPRSHTTRYASPPAAAAAAAPAPLFHRRQLARRTLNTLHHTRWVCCRPTRCARGGLGGGARGGEGGPAGWGGSTRRAWRTCGGCCGSRGTGSSTFCRWGGAASGDADMAPPLGLALLAAHPPPRPCPCAGAGHQ